MFPSSLRFRSTQTIVEVGAYTGDDKLIEACRTFGHHLYLFEANPRHAETIKQKVGAAKRIHVISKAVSNFNGTAPFNIASHDDCSSLLDFDKNANTAWVHQWHPYQSFEMVDHVEVDVVRLDTFMEQNGIERVDFLEIDAQGEDLRIVEGLGDRISDVRKIQIEVNIHDSPLYSNSFGLSDAMAFFDERGFDRHISWKQSMGREENVIFRNRRFYRNPAANALLAAFEQQSHNLYFSALKLPRVLSVTKMIVGKKLRGES